MNDRETLAKAAELLDDWCPRGAGLVVARRLREMAASNTDNSAAVIATLRACLAEMGREASGAQDFYWSVRQRLGMTRDDSALVETVIDQKLARIAELEPLQEVVSQLEDEKRALEQKCERLREALDWYAEMARQMQRATLHMDNQTMLHLMKELALDGGRRANQSRRLTAEAMKENDNGR